MSYCIREARKAAKITQAELAAKLGINRATLSKYESGSIEPSVPQLKKIAQALQLECWSDLVSDDEKAQVIIKHITEGLKNTGSFRKLSDSEAHKAGFLQFNSDADRLSYFYSKLNDEGKRVAADRVQELSEIPKYRETPEEK